MNRSRSNNKLENPPQQNLSDEQLYRLILKAYDEAHDTEQMQTIIKAIMVDDPERIRVAYRRVVKTRGRSRVTSELPRPDTPQRPPPVTVVLVDTSGVGSRQSQRRKSGQSSKGGKSMLVVIEATGMRESGILETLKSEMSALCQVQHQNLLTLVSYTAMKGNRFTLEFDLASTSHVTLLDMFQGEAESSHLNGCEVACVLSQVCLGMLFLLDCASPLLTWMELSPGECLLTENIILTHSGLIKLSGHHAVLRLPRVRCTPERLEVEIEEDENVDSQQLQQQEGYLRRRRPGFLAHRVAMLLYELDHPQHRPLRCLHRCPNQERRQLDERYARLFSLCAEWDVSQQVDLRIVLYSDFINEQTSAITSYQSPLELVFASRFG